MRRRSLAERMISVNDTWEMMAHGWKRSQCVNSQEMMVHEQQRCLGAGTDPQSFEGVAQLSSRLLNRGRAAVRHRGIGCSGQRHETGVRIEAERQQEHRDCPGEKRPESMGTVSHGVSLFLVHLTRQRYC